MSMRKFDQNFFQSQYVIHWKQRVIKKLTKPNFTTRSETFIAQNF